MFGLPIEIWLQIIADNPTIYYRLLHVSKAFTLDTDMMKAKFIRRTEGNGDIYYRLPNGWLHSCNDQPALIWADGSQWWYNNGKLHRYHDQPAVILISGTQRWYINGRQHRDNDRPAEISWNGGRFWCKNGKVYEPHHNN